MAMNEKQKSVMLVVMVFGFLGLLTLGYYEVVWMRAETKSANLEKGKIGGQIAEKTKQYAQIRSVLDKEGEMERIRTAIDKVSHRLPTTPDAPGFLNALVQVLRVTGIIQQSVMPKGAIGRAQYTELPYGVSAFGRYHELGQFLTLIEQNPDRFMRVKSFKLTNNRLRPSIHTIDMQITTFMFNRAATPSKPAAPGKK